MNEPDRSDFERATQKISKLPVIPGGSVPETGLILDRIKSLEERVKKLEQENDRRDNYEAEQREYSE